MADFPKDLYLIEWVENGKKCRDVLFDLEHVSAAVRMFDSFDIDPEIHVQSLPRDAWKRVRKSDL